MIRLGLRNPRKKERKNLQSYTCMIWRLFKLTWNVTWQIIIYQVIWRGARRAMCQVNLSSRLVCQVEIVTASGIWRAGKNLRSFTWQIIICQVILRGVRDHSWSSYWFSNKQHYLSLSDLKRGKKGMCQVNLSSRLVCQVELVTASGIWRAGKNLRSFNLDQKNNIRFQNHFPEIQLD